MKKLNLQLGSIKEMLTKEQMKKIIGGTGYGGDTCNDGADCKVVTISGGVTH